MPSGSSDDNVDDEEACRARLGEHYAFQSGQRPELSMEQCLDMIRAKMDIRSTKPSDSLRQIARIFGAAGDCDLEIDRW